MVQIKRERITLRDVARAASVSPMTVSRVIRGFHNVTPTTRHRVSFAIENLGYRPNPALSALGSYRRGSSSKIATSTIAYLDGSPTMESAEILRGAMEGAAHIGYSVERFHFADEPKSQQYLQRILFHRGIRGLLLGPIPNVERLQKWDWSNFATVQLGAQTHSSRMHAVALDHFQAAFTACKTLQGQGYGRIALVVDPQAEVITDNRWYGGYCAALKGSGQAPFFADSAWGSPKLEKWIRQNKIDGMLTVDSNCPAPGGEPWRIALSKKLGVVLLLDHHLPNMAAMSVDYRNLGFEGIRILHHYLYKSEYGLPSFPYFLCLPSRLIQRDAKGKEFAASCRPEAA